MEGSKEKGSLFPLVEMSMWLWMVFACYRVGSSPRPATIHHRLLKDLLGSRALQNDTIGFFHLHYPVVHEKRSRCVVLQRGFENQPRDRVCDDVMHRRGSRLLPYYSCCARLTSPLHLRSARPSLLTTLFIAESCLAIGHASQTRTATRGEPKVSKYLERLPGECAIAPFYFQISSFLVYSRFWLVTQSSKCTK
jgi:hypothetical protein